MRRLYVGQGDGRVGKAGHAKLRKMTMESSALASGQDSLRSAVTGPTREEYGRFDERQEVTHSHSRIAGSVASTPKRSADAASPPKAKK